MILKLDGCDYTIPERLEQQFIEQFYTLMLGKYEGMNATLRLALKPIARAVLMDMEKKYGPEIRPAKGADPTLHLFTVFLSVVREGMSIVEATIDTAGTAEITAFGVRLSRPDEGGGPMAARGNVGVGQDDGSKAPGPNAGQALSDLTALHS